MIIDILSLFPGYFKGPLDESIIRRAVEKKIIEIRLKDIRDFADNRHRRVDDRPYGGGPGMVMQPGPVAAAIRSVKQTGSHVVYLSPQGRPLSAEKSRQLAEKQHLVLLCGHYEGIDERVLAKEVDEEISIGDYVLTNGCLAAIVLLDTVIRFLPGVLGHELASVKDSFEDGLLEGPSYTRPSIWEGMEVPEVLLTGHHEEIEKWRLEEGMRKTKLARPDLLGFKNVDIPAALDKKKI